MIHSLIAYVGPETAMPLLSAIAAVGGALLMFGKTTMRYLFRKSCSVIGLGRTEEPLDSSDSAPESTT